MKTENDELIKKLEAAKGVVFKNENELKKQVEEKNELKKENQKIKWRIVALEKQLKVAKNETEEANMLSQENQALKSATNAANDELKVAKLESKEVRESEAEYKRQI